MGAQLLPTTHFDQVTIERVCNILTGYLFDVGLHIRIGIEKLVNDVRTLLVIILNY